MLNNIIYSDSPTRKAGFITENGKFINLQENKVQLIGYASKDVIHSAFADYLKKQGINPSELNLIRFNDGAYIYVNEEAYIELCKKEPNKKQYEAILKWFDFLSLNSKKKYVCIGINCRSERFEFINCANKEGLLPEQLIEEIKKMYIRLNKNEII